MWCKKEEKKESSDWLLCHVKYSLNTFNLLSICQNTNFGKYTVKRSVNSLTQLLAFLRKHLIHTLKCYHINMC